MEWELHTPARVKPHERRFNIGNELTVRWSLYSGRRPAVFDERVLRFCVVCPSGRRLPFGHTLVGSVLYATIPADRQRESGWHDLELTAYGGTGNQMKVYIPRAFLLRADRDARPQFFDEQVLELSCDFGTAGAPPCLYCYADGAEVVDLPEAERCAALRVEAAALDPSVACVAGDGRLVGMSVPFTFEKPYLWLLQPADVSPFVTATDVETGFIFPFEDGVEQQSGGRRYLCRRSNGLPVGELVALIFS